MYSEKEKYVLQKYYPEVLEAVDFAVKTIKKDFSRFAEGFGIPNIDILFLPQASCCRVQVVIENYSERIVALYFKGWNGNYDKYGNSGIIFVDLPCEEESNVNLFLRKLVEDHRGNGWAYAGDRLFPAWF